MANIDDVVAQMKKYKILHLKQGDLELTLHPDALIEEADVTPPEADPKDTEVGRGGQTRAQQLAMFGTVFEHDFIQKKA